MGECHLNQPPPTKFQQEFYPITLNLKPSAPNIMANSSISRVTFKAFCQAEGITAIHKTVRENTNKYPFVTVLRGSEAENIYFSKKASAEVSEGEIVKAIANDLFINVAVNQAGESRTKLSFAGNSSYEDIDDMF